MNPAERLQMRALCYVMDLTSMDNASGSDARQGLVEWANAFTARDWEQVERIENPGVKEAVKQMRVIMSTPSQRDMVWARRMAEIDYTGGSPK